MTTTAQTRREYRQQQERQFREEITAAFRAGKIGIENGWLCEETPGCRVACTEYGCPPSCYSIPIMDLWPEHRP